MSDYQVQYDSAQKITQLHVQCFEEIDSLAETSPTTIDGGPVATALLWGILSPIAADAGSIAAINFVAAERMYTTVNLYTGIEDSAEAAFEKMAEAIE